MNMRDKGYKNAIWRNHKQTREAWTYWNIYFYLRRADSNSMKERNVSSSDLTILTDLTGEWQRSL